MSRRRMQSAMMTVLALVVVEALPGALPGTLPGAGAGAAWGQSRQEAIADLSGFIGPEGVPDGWYAFVAPDGELDYKVTDEGPGGARALVVEGKADYGGAAGMHLPLNRQRRYIASGWVKIEGEAGATAAVKIDYYNAAGEYLADTQAAITAAAEGWQPVSVIDRAEEHPEAREVALTLLMTGEGRAWFSKPQLHVRPRDEANLLRNGGVELVAGRDEMPPEWDLSANEGAAVSIAPSEDNPQDGRFCLHLSGRDAEWASASATAGPMPIEEGKVYKLSGYARARSGEASLAIVYFRDGFEYLGHSQSQPVTEDAWTKVELTSELGAHPQATEISAGAFGSGDVEAWFDALVLTAE